MDTELIQSLAVALGLGVVVGLERGFRTRGEDTRAIGARTFALTALLGGVVGALAQLYTPWLLGLGFIALGMLVAAAYVVWSRSSGDPGATTEVALLLVFALGALCSAGHEVEAAGAAIVSALVLGSKTRVYAFLRRIDESELFAVLQLLLAAVVVLPLLPDRGVGPWEAVNPRNVGLLALLIAGMSFAGYVAVRLLGERRGTLLAAFFGGLTSSTAVTVAFARQAGAAPQRARLLGAGIALACATMPARLALAVAVVAPEVVSKLAWPLGALTLTCALGALLAARGAKSGASDAGALELRNPLDLRAALTWAGLLALMSLLARALHVWLGTPGVYALATLSGVADVDAIALSLARMTPGAITPEVAARAIAVAALTNTLAKAGLALLLGGGALARSGGAILLAALVAGALATALV